MIFLDDINLWIKEEHEQVKRKLKTMDEVMQSSNQPAKHRTYHVPPGTKCHSEYKYIASTLATICTL